METFTAWSTAANAAAAWFQAIAALAVAIFALRQLKSERTRRNEAQAERTRELSLERQRRLETETLRVCGLYDNDPVLTAVCKRIWDGSGGGKNYPGNGNKHDVIILTNYLDGIAIGISQGVYQEAMVRDNLESTFLKLHDQILPAFFPDKTEREKDYENFHRIVQRWKEKPPAYKSAHVASDV